MTAAQEMTVKRQALSVPGESSELEVVLEKRYSEQLLRSKGRGKLVAENPTAPGHKPVTSCPPWVDQTRARRHPQATPEESQRGRMERRDKGFGSERGTPVPDPAGNQQTTGE